MAIIDGKIKCSVCKYFKETENYAPSMVKDGNGTCRPCTAERSAAQRSKDPEKINENFRRWYHRHKEIHVERSNKWRDKNKSAIHNRHLIRTYGITLEKFNEIIEFQGGGCGICGKTQDQVKLRLAVDHCHSLNIVRGVLCQTCNRALGIFGDNIDGLEKALNYLKRAKSWQTKDAPV